MTLKALPLQERPRERLLAQGIEALAVVELIALILGSGTRGKSVLNLAQELLIQFGSLANLKEASIEDLCEIKGVGKAKAIQLKAACALAQRLQVEEMPSLPQLQTPHDVYQWVKERCIHQKKELFGVILQNAKGRVMGWEVISIGTLTQVIVHPREVFYPAIHHLAASIILVHNHPSGDPTPSPQDLHLTRQLVKASHTIGIPIRDHLIITKKNYISLKESGFQFV